MITLINTIVGVIGIAVGIIGWKSLSASKIKNKAKATDSATIQQAQTINNGLSSVDVINLTEDIVDKKIREKTDLNDNKNHFIIKYMGIVGVLFSHGKSYEINLSNLQCKLVISSACSNKYYPNKIICSIIDDAGNRIPISVSNTTIDIVPLRIMDGFYTNVNNGIFKEAEVFENQTVIGYLKNRNILYVSFYKKSNRPFSIRIVAYGPQNSDKKFN